MSSNLLKTKTNRYIFMDMEFNTIKKINEIISVGAIICDENLNIVDKFYSYVKLSMTNKMDAYCINLTKITDKELENAPLFNTVFSDFMNFLNLQESDKVFVWGDYDKHVLITNTTYHNSFDKFSTLLDSIVDIQPSICKTLLVDGSIISDRINLKDVKEMCGLNNKVSHNALDDAIDLKDVFSKYSQNAILESDILKVYLRNKEKQESKNHQKEFLKNYSNRYTNGLSISKLDKKMFQHLKKLCKLKDTNFRNSNPSLSYNEDLFIIKSDSDEIIFNPFSNQATYNFKVQGNRITITINVQGKEFKFTGKSTYTTQGLVCALLKKVIDENKKAN